MPHVVVTGCTPREALEALGRETARAGAFIFRTTAGFTADDAGAALVEGVVVEQGRPQALLALVSQRPDGVVVRLSPFVDHVERTEGVLRWVAWLGRRIHDAREGRTYGPTNLDRFLALPA